MSIARCSSGSFRISSSGSFRPTRSRPFALAETNKVVLGGRSRIACHIIAPIHQLLADSDHVCCQLFGHRGVKPGKLLPHLHVLLFKGLHDLEDETWPWNNPKPVPVHKRAKKKRPQSVPRLVARRSKSPAISLCCPLSAPKVAIRTIVRNPVITEYVAQPRQRGSLAKRRARMKRPTAMAGMDTDAQTRWITAVRVVSGRNAPFREPGARSCGNKPSIV